MPQSILFKFFLMLLLSILFPIDDSHVSKILKNILYTVKTLRPSFFHTISIPLCQLLPVSCILFVQTKANANLFILTLL